MKVICKNVDGCFCSTKGVFGGLTEDKEYEIIRESEDNYWIINDFGYKDYYHRKRFEIAKENVVEVENVIKIKDLKELNGKQFGQYKIDAKYDNTIFIDKDEYDDSITIPLLFGNEAIIKILSALGIEIEFETNPTLTKIEHDFVIGLAGIYDDGWLARDTKGDYKDRLYFYDTKPERQVTYFVNDEQSIKIDKEGMFSFITYENSPWSLSDLTKLEVKG